MGQTGEAPVSELLVGPLRSVRRASSTDAREINRRSALHAIASRVAVTRAEIARVTGLTRPTVSSLVGELIDEGLVVEGGPGASAGGKRPTLLAIDTAARQVIAVDASAPVPTGRLLDLGGEVLAEATARPARAGDDAAAAITELVARLARSATAPLAGVGMGTPGLVDADGTVVEAANLGWHDRPLRAELEAAIGLPVFVANDADAAALVEFGRLPEKRDGLALVRIGAGIGAGLVLAGRPHPGSRAAAGEIGHLVVIPGGALCSCGNHGCLETVASVRAILGAAGADPADPPADLAALLRDHGAQAELALDLAVLHLGAVIAHLVAILDVGDVVLSVQLPGAGQLLAERVADVVAERLLPQHLAELEIRAAEDTDSLVLDGAHALVLAGSLGMVRP